MAPKRRRRSDSIHSNSSCSSGSSFADEGGHRADPRPRAHSDHLLPPSSAVPGQGVGGIGPAFIPTCTSRTQILPLLQCQVCSNGATRRMLSATAPVTLPCGHTLCASHIPTAPESSFTCPLRDCETANPGVGAGPGTTTRGSVVIYSAIRPHGVTGGSLRPPLLRPQDLQELKPDIKVIEILTLDDDGGGSANTDGRDDDVAPNTKTPSPPRRTKRPRRHTHSTSSTSTAFTKELKSILSCGVCFMLLYEPVTLMCGHTFCALCLQRTVDQDPKCPMCRTPLNARLKHLLSLMDVRGGGGTGASCCSVPTNKLLLGTILLAFSREYMGRRQLLLQELNALREEGFTVPLYQVGEVIFPGMRTRLSFTQSEHRLMLRRILAEAAASPNSTAHLGTVLPTALEAGYGTLVSLVSVQYLPDNGAVAEVEGLARRFRVVEGRAVDGYLVARVEEFDDVPEDEEDDEPTAEADSNASSSLTPGVGQNHQAQAQTQIIDLSQEPTSASSVPSTMESMIEYCKRFVDEMGTDAAPWIVKRYRDEYGSQPVGDPVAFGWWAASHLPISHQEKSKLLAIRSPKLRLGLICHWISTLSEEWWYSRGCIIS